MNETLESLWDAYLSEHRVDYTGERGRVMQEAREVEQRLRATLSEAQLQDMETLDALEDDLSSFAQKEAFFNGIRFATKFLFEALCEN